MRRDLGRWGPVRENVAVTPYPRIHFHDFQTKRSAKNAGPHHASIAAFSEGKSPRFESNEALPVSRVIGGRSHYYVDEANPARAQARSRERAADPRRRADPLQAPDSRFSGSKATVRGQRYCPRLLVRFLSAMNPRRPLLVLLVVMMVAGLPAQTPPAPSPAPAVPPPEAAAAPAATTPTAPAPATAVAPVPAGNPAPTAKAKAPTITKEQALKEIDAGLAAFELTARTETSPVIQAAMMTRLTVLRQRRADLAKAFTLGRFRSLQASILQEVRVENKMTPTSDPNEGRLRRSLTLDQSVNAATGDANRMLALDAARRDEQYRADRAAEESSRRLMEVSRINADLSRLSSQIDASTVGDPGRRAEMTMRLRELEQERTRLELSAQPSTFETLRSDIQREADRARQP